MAETPRLDLPYIAASQAQKEVTHSIGLDRLDLLVQCSVLDRNLTAPPASPALGDAYIVGPAPTGAWAGRANALALWISSQWELIDPLPGFTCWVIDEAVLVVWSGTAWTIASAGGGGTTTLLGLTDTPDTYSGQAGKTLIVNAGETAVEFGTTAGSAPVEAPYVVTAPHALLSAERVVTDTTQIQWDTTTAGALKATLAPGGVALDRLAPQPQGTLLGRGDTLSPVDEVQALTVGPGLTLAGTTLSATGGGGGSAALGAVVQRLATQGIVSNTNVAVSFDTETRDDAAFFDPGAPTRLSVAQTGWYSLSAFVQWDATSGVTRIVNIRVNGTQYIAVESTGTAGVDQRQTVAVQWYLMAADYVEIVLFQSTAGTRQITANASIVGMTTAPDPATTFLALTDTPDTYSGQAGALVRVNAGATALEFTPGLTGTPLSVTRYAASGEAMETGSPTVVIDASGRLGVGTATPLTPLHMVGELRIEAGFLRAQRDGTTAVVLLEASGDVATAVYGGLTLSRARGTTASRTAVQAGDRLALVQINGYGTSMGNAATIESVAEEPFTASARGARLTLSTTTLGTTTLTERLRLDSQGKIGLHTTLTATLDSGATYQALTIQGSTLYVGQSTVQERAQALVQAAWVASADATRRGRLVLQTYDWVAAREGLRIEADGTASKLGFLGSAAVVRQTVPAAATDAGTVQTLVNAVRTALINFGLCV